MMRNISRFTSRIDHCYNERRGIVYSLRPHGDVHRHTISQKRCISCNLKSCIDYVIHPINHSHRHFGNSSTNKNANLYPQDEKEENPFSFRKSKNLRKKNDNSNENKTHRPKRTANLPHSLGVNTEWVRVTGIPPLSTIDELLVDIERIMNTELNTGIIDLDAAEQSLLNQVVNQKQETVENIEPSSPPPLPLWNPNDDENVSNLPSHMVIEARMNLSTLYRQAGWFLRFPNRSCVHALLSHIEEANRIRKEYRIHGKMGKQKKIDRVQGHKENEEDIQTISKEFTWMNYDVRPLKCGWKEVDVFPFYLKSKAFYSDIDWIDDTVVRVENCPLESTVDDLRYFFNLYDLRDDRILTEEDDTREAVQLVVTGNKSEQEKLVLDDDTNIDKLSFTPSRTNTFLVQFATTADARAAVREKQSVEFMGKKIKLAQFSRQMFLR